MGRPDQNDLTGARTELDASALYREGKLTEAIASLNAEVRDHPTDVQRRTFLFELLCFDANYERAAKQLDVLAQGDPEAMTGILSYHTVLACETARQEMFQSGSFPESKVAPRPVRGRLNGEPFERLEDADPRIGARLELFLGGQYNWLPLEHLKSVRIETPKKLRDLLWVTASIEGGDALDGADFGEALIPGLTPLAAQHPDDLVRLGRVTQWIDLDNDLQAPVGGKMLLVDDEEFPILEVRELEIEGPSTTSG